MAARVVSAVVAVSLLTATLGIRPAPAAANAPSAEAIRKPTVIAVRLGKPTELAFHLSRKSLLPSGTVTFEVTNMGVAYHSFKLCLKPVPDAAHATNACSGSGTPILKPGESATLTVTLAKKGLYEFLCSVTGHAAAGMKGLLGIGVVTPKPVTRTSVPAVVPITSAPDGCHDTSSCLGPAIHCPPGVVIRASGSVDGDGDGDELGTEPDDQDGCV